MSDYTTKSQQAMNGMIVAINLFKFLVATSHEPEVFDRVQMKESTQIRFEKDHVLELIGMLKPLIVEPKHQKRAKKELRALVEVMTICEWLPKELPRELQTLLNKAAHEEKPLRVHPDDETQMAETNNVIMMKSRSIH